ncbi:hypothetical protein F2Q69_00027634 [Brassica cretica]|uniref:Uncharacterized protein n=1 Tax=Brassica cretica TaxID=69181 RepID=A0A8S9RZF4_BRACR|nr:hypothetical protein F2Q69_00027634 [Brassica cretica]
MAGDGSRIDLITSLHTFVVVKEQTFSFLWRAVDTLCEVVARVCASEAEEDVELELVRLGDNFCLHLRSPIFLD